MEEEGKLIQDLSQFIRSLDDVYIGQCFQSSFGSRHPYLVIKIFGGTLAAYIGTKIKEI